MKENACDKDNCTLLTTHKKHNNNKELNIIALKLHTYKTSPTDYQTIDCGVRYSYTLHHCHLMTT